MSFIKHLFKKEQAQLQICSPASGNLTEITKLSDAVFSRKMMGEGFFIEPIERKICEIVSPLSGVIENIFETKHAISIHHEKIDLLLHLGLDTVEMKGLPFDILVEPGQSVVAGEIIAKMNVEEIVANGKTAEIIAVFPELPEKMWSLEKSGQIDAGEAIGKIQN